MADRQADETPLAPRRTLSGPAANNGSRDDSKPPLTERVSAAVSAAGNAIQAAATSGPGPTRGGTSVDSRPNRGPQPQKQASPPARPKSVRRARLRLIHLDPWSVMKTSFLLSIALGIVTVVAVAVVWSVLGAAGVWDSINRTVSNVVGGDTAQTFDVKNYVGTSRVLGFTMIVAVVDVILITAMSTLAAFLYNLAAALLGGVEVTLAEDDR
jgi:hypothetical protein